MLYNISVVLSPGGQYSDADLARSLLFTISNDIGHIACLYAMMHKLNKVSSLFAFNTLSAKAIFVRLKGVHTFQ